MDKKEVIEKLKLLLDNKTYAFIKTTSSRWYNGYLKKIDENFVLFYDDILKSIPILISEIDMVEPSTKLEKEKNEKM